MQCLLCCANQDGITAAMIASNEGQTEALALLLSYKADINAAVEVMHSLTCEIHSICGIYFAFEARCELFPLRLPH
jgi:ankyrin repeat protein